MGVRVATLNAWGLPAPFSDRLTERMAAIGSRLQTLDADVVAFQEVWTGESRRGLISAGRRAGFSEAWHNEARLGGSGLLVLTRLPILSEGFERFSVRGFAERLDHADYYGGKGFTRLRLRTADGPLTLIDTHLHARHSSDMAHAYRPHRTAQIVQLASAAAKIEGPIIALGDFNFDEGQDEHAILTGLTGLRDVAIELDQREPTVWKGNAYRLERSKPGRRIDYVFVRDGVHQGLVARRLTRAFDEVFELPGGPASYSDHAGLLAEVELVSNPRAVSAPSRDVVALASGLLSEGVADAHQRQRGRRTWAGMGIAGAVLASAGMRTRPLNRRRFLRGGLQTAGLLALTPSIGCGILSEVFAPSEIRAFEAVAARLAVLEVLPADQGIA
jgi:endonuclease/exonuclease/phosphatase family metal-dependent hydrolase